MRVESYKEDVGGGEYHDRGFSLIELLVVVAIIGVLAAGGIIAYQTYLDASKKDTLEAILNSTSRAAEQDLLSIQQSLGGRSSLLDEPLGADPKCRDVAREMVTSLNKQSKNPFGADLPSAVYGNLVSDHDPTANPPIRRFPTGVVIVSCGNPDGRARLSHDILLYQCTCDSAECAFDPPPPNDEFPAGECPVPVHDSSASPKGPCYGFGPDDGSGPNGACEK